MKKKKNQHLIIVSVKFFFTLFINPKIVLKFPKTDVASVAFSSVV